MIIALSLMSSCVYAIENTFKVSATITGSTTTPPVASSTPSTGNWSGTRVLIMKYLRVVSTNNSGEVLFTTDDPTVFKISWGTTKDYELGSIVGSLYEFDHSIKISGLNSETTYYYKVEVTDKNGIFSTAEGSFTSKKNPDLIPPTNVTYFQAIPQENGINLLWKAPENKNINLVRVVRSDKFFPRNINEGEIIYEGKQERYFDTSVIKDKMYYYAIFVQDTEGNYSSGVLAQARISSSYQPSTTTTPLVEIPIIKNTDLIIKELKLSDFDFIQNGEKIENLESSILIDGSKDLIIQLDNKKVSKDLKTITVTLTDTEDPSKVYTFLLGVNKSGTLYEASIAPLGKSGKYNIDITVLDYKNQGLQKIIGLLKVPDWKIGQDIFKNCGIFDGSNNCGDSNIKDKLVQSIILIISLSIVVLGFIYIRIDNKKVFDKI